MVRHPGYPVALEFRKSSKSKYILHMNISTCRERLAIRYQLWSQRSQQTVEKAQILENKRTHLQKRMDMFALQSDAFLLNHKITEDVSMLSLGNYSEYDFADDIDESGVPGQSGDVQFGHPHRSNTKDGLETNAEDVPILLPSSLGWAWCIQQGLKVLANKEATLRFAQATAPLHRIHLALGFKAALFRSDVRHSRTQKTKTRAWAAVHSIDASVHEHARNYSMARDAYLKVIDQSGESPDLSKLQLLTSALTPLPLEQEKPDKAISNSHGSGTLLPLTSKMEPRQRTVSAYLFRIAGEIFSNGPVNRVHWLRAKAQFERWKEEQDSIHNEVVWVPAYFHTMAELWKAQVEFSV